VRRAAIDAVLERVGLSDAGRKRIKDFSQGMKQRLGLAAALMHSPQVLVIDEPTNGLDPAGIGWLRDLIGELAAAGVTILLSSHQLGEVERVCDRVAVMNGGRLVESGSIAGLGSSEDRVRVVIRADQYDAARAALAGHSVSDEGEPDVFYVCGAAAPDVAKALAEKGIYPEAIVREASSLEQRFLQLTGAPR
jgi:ABC-2 type transport system ATP-binding protein